MRQRLIDQQTAQQSESRIGVRRSGRGIVSYAIRCVPPLAARAKPAHPQRVPCPEGAGFSSHFGAVTGPWNRSPRPILGGVSRLDPAHRRAVSSARVPRPAHARRWSQDRRSAAASRASPGRVASSATICAGSPARRGAMSTLKSTPDDALDGVDHFEHREAVAVAAIERQRRRAARRWRSASECARARSLT